MTIDVRTEGWEQRLDSVISVAGEQPYEIGQHDCFRVACEVVAALTGVPSRFGEWRGKYHSEREAIGIILARGGFVRAASDWFGSDPVNVKLARRGDICAYKDSTRMRHLGVCVGDKVAVLGEGGLLFVPLLQCLCAWRVG